MRVKVTQMGQSWVPRKDQKTGRVLPGIWHYPGEIIDVPENKYSATWMVKLDGPSVQAVQPQTVTATSIPTEAPKRGRPRKIV